jgi:uncharacterized membrane protein YfcA
METAIILLLSVILMAFAAPFAMIGMGGGTAYVPIMEIGGINVHEASTISLFMILFSTVSAAIVFHQKKAIDWKFLLYIIPPVVIGSFLGGYASHFVDSSAISIVFAVYLCFAAFLIYKNDYSKEGQIHERVPKWLVVHRVHGEHQYSVSLGVLIPMVIGMGFLAGMLGVGGGLFLLPVLILLFRVPMRITIGVSTIYAGISALVGLAGHIASGDLLNIWIAIPLAIAVFIGARIGSQLSHRISLPKLKIAIAIILIALAGVMLFKVL